MIYGWLFQIALFPFVRQITRKIHGDRLWDRLLHWLEEKSARRPEDALTEKQILKYKVIRSVDPAIIKRKGKKRIVRELGRRGLIRNKWCPHLSTSLMIEWQRFFLGLSSLMTETVAPSVAELYTGKNIGCFVNLPFPRDRKEKCLVDFEKALENHLDTRRIDTEWFASGILEGKIKTQWVNKLKEGQGILILQPMALDDDYLQRTVDYIRSISMGHIVEVITIIDGSGRPNDKRCKDPLERVLIELNLNQKIS